MSATFRASCTRDMSPPGYSFRWLSICWQTLRRVSICRPMLESERAALALTEAMTTLPGTNVPDAEYDEAARCFDAEELGALIFAIVAINAWNRIGVTTRMVAGTYEP